MRRRRLHFLHRSAREHRARARSEIGFADEAILVLDEEPVLLVRSAHERERTFHLLAPQENAQLAFLQPLANLPLGLFAILDPGGFFVGRIHAAVPDDDLARAVLA